MTGRDYALLIGLLLWFAAACWLAVALSEARTETEALRAERDGLQLDLDNERAEHRDTINLWAKGDGTWGVLFDDANAEHARERAKLRKERDDAHRCLALVLNDEDVAAVLDMSRLLRDSAPIIRHHFPLRSVR